MRIKSTPGDPDAPRIDPDEVARFFAIRAQKAKDLGTVRAVIYQDKHPDLAERRDAAEKAALLPLLGLRPQDRVLDVGCGTGRWTSELAPRAAHYHGTDFAPGLIDVARAEHRDRPNARFSVLSSVDVTLEGMGEQAGFERIVVLGLLIYLNDEDVIASLSQLVGVAAPDCRILIREPVALGERLTIKEHFSDDLDQVYNAIYRTDAELRDAFAATLEPAGFRLAESDDVYKADDLNNRADTRQRWYLLERGDPGR
jgi:SAM-dependent methyltransferase